MLRKLWLFAAVISLVSSAQSATPIIQLDDNSHAFLASDEAIDYQKSFEQYKLQADEIKLDPSETVPFWKDLQLWNELELLEMKRAIKLNLEHLPTNEPALDMNPVALA